ncbi:MAG: sigma-70 family RNA polymerase sigma factor [Planctomycetota bacterium]|jgi:RNA polymerase sigma factor (sigma-70 family)
MAQDALLRQHLGSLRAFVRLRSDRQLRLRESESDIVQSICREVLSDLGSFEYRNAAGFRSWLFTLALNKVREKGRFHQAERRTSRREDGSLDRDPTLRAHYASFFTPSEHAMAREVETEFEVAFDGLSEDHREVIILSRILSLPHREIAHSTGRTEVAVRSLLSRALVALSAELERRRKHA